MKKFVLAALLGLLTLAVSQQNASASGWNCNGCGQGGKGGWCLNFGGCGIGFWKGSSAYMACGDCHGCPSLGPWYLYWPYDCHFQTPAPTGYPFGPAPMTAGPFGHGGGGGYYPGYWQGH